jgi:RNA polymerase sigma factor (sigma-70 family)
VSSIYPATSPVPIDCDDRGRELAEFETLFRENYVAIVRTALRVAGSRQEAEKIAAEAFAKLFREGKGVRNPIGWLKRCAVRRALDSLRASQRRRKREETVQPASDGCNSPETILRLNEQRFQVRRVLAELSIRDAEMLLARAGGSSYQDIAGDFGIHAASVGKLLSRAEENFKNRWEHHYGTHPHGTHHDGTR